MIQVAIAFAILLGLAHFYSEKFCLVCKAYGGAPKVVALFGGVAVTYLLLDLLPFFSEKVLETNRFLFLFLLLGFVIFHVVEKYTYILAPRDKLKTEIALEQSIALFIYHFLIGVAFVSFAKGLLLGAFLFFIPILLYTSISAFVVKPVRNYGLRILFASGSLIGVIFAGVFYTSINISVNLAFLGFVIGALFYIIIRHSIPTGREGKPMYFLLGSLIYSLLIMFSWSLV